MDDPPEHGSQLALASHGRRLTIGSFLSPGERLDLARALRAALSAAKSPVTSPVTSPASSPTRGG